MAGGSLPLTQTRWEERAGTAWHPKATLSQQSCVHRYHLAGPAF